MNIELLKNKFTELLDIFKACELESRQKYQNGQIDGDTYHKYINFRNHKINYILKDWEYLSSDISLNYKYNFSINVASGKLIDFNYIENFLKKFFDFLFKICVTIQDDKYLTILESQIQSAKELNKILAQNTNYDLVPLQKFIYLICYIIDTDLIYLNSDFDLSDSRPHAMPFVKALYKKQVQLLEEIEIDFEALNLETGIFFEDAKSTRYGLLEAYQENPEGINAIVNRYQDRAQTLYESCYKLNHQLADKYYTEKTNKPIDLYKEKYPNIFNNLYFDEISRFIYLIDHHPEITKDLEKINSSTWLCETFFKTSILKIDSFTNPNIFKNINQAYEEFHDVFISSFFEYLFLGYASVKNRYLNNLFDDNYKDKLNTIRLIIASPDYERIKKIEELDNDDSFRDYNYDVQSGSYNTLGECLAKLIFNGIINLNNYDKFLKVLLSPNNSHNQFTYITTKETETRDFELRTAKNSLLESLKLSPSQNKEFVDLFFSTPMGMAAFEVFNALEKRAYGWNLGNISNLLLKSMNKQANFAPRLAEFFALNRYFCVLPSMYSDSLQLLDLIFNPEYEIFITNLDQFSNIIRQFIFVSRKIHNAYGNYPINERKNYLDIIATFIKSKYDVSSDSFSKLIDLAFNDTILKTKEFNKKCYILGFQPQDISVPLMKLKQQFADHRLELSRAEIYDLDNKINLVEVYDSIQSYKPLKKDKSEDLYRLNYQITDKLKFEVLPNNSFEYFTVGAETNCCQRVNRPGAAACVDSYINPLAGVLVLRGNFTQNGKKKDVVIAQSYFHYVPEDDGFILDNVEANTGLIKTFKINLDNLYASLAKQVEKDYNVNYFRCGTGFNKLNDKSFEEVDMKNDPRHFESEALGLDIPTGDGRTTNERYTDCKENVLNLLNPKGLDIIPLEKIDFKLTEQASIRFYLTCLAALTNNLLK